MSKILLDSSFIIALFRKNDPNHEIAKKNLEVLDNDCYITNSLLSEIITVIMMRTKDIELTKKIFQYIKDNFKVIIETSIPNYDDGVFSLFKKYNSSTYNASYIDCSCILVYMNFNLDYVVSIDKFYEEFDEIQLLELKSD